MEISIDLLPVEMTGQLPLQLLYLLSAGLFEQRPMYFVADMYKEVWITR